MYDWLRRKFEYRSIAEMSIWYTITAVGSFMVIFLLWSLFTGLASGPKEYDSGASKMLSLLVALFLWLVFIVWLCVGLVRTAWKWGHERLGTTIFKYLQIGFLVMTVLTMLARGDLRENFKILSFILLVFDMAIACMIFNFLVLAWFARCKIPLHAYWEIISIIVMIIIQIWVFT